MKCLAAILGVALLMVVVAACGAEKTPAQSPEPAEVAGGLAPQSAPSETQASKVTEAPAKAGKIVCHAAYRASVTVPIEREETITFTDSDAQQSISFADLDWHAQYRTGKLDGERGLVLWVTAAGQPDRLISQLYQLPLESGPQNQFIGSLGFTGLNYAYHPASSAELQYWCEAD
jgi:hypothetical protein